MRQRLHGLIATLFVCRAELEGRVELNAELQVALQAVQQHERDFALTVVALDIFPSQRVALERTTGKRRG